MQVFEIIRKKLGYTKYKMAKELGIKWSHYYTVATKTTKTNPQMLIKLHEVSGLTLEEFWDILKKS